MVQSSAAAGCSPVKLGARSKHDPARLDDGIHLMKVCDIPERISPNEKDVGAHAGLERTDLFFQPEMPRSDGRGGLECRFRRQSRLDQ